jgi:hypothetical protein
MKERLAKSRELIETTFGTIKKWPKWCLFPLLGLLTGVAFTEISEKLPPDFYDSKLRSELRINDFVFGKKADQDQTGSTIK